MSGMKSLDRRRHRHREEEGNLCRFPLAGPLSLPPSPVLALNAVVRTLLRRFRRRPFPPSLGEDDGENQINREGRQRGSLHVFSTIIFPLSLLGDLSLSPLGAQTTRP